MEVIKVKNLRKIFKIPREHRGLIREHVFTLFKSQKCEEFCALSNISFTVKKGEFFGIVGANGSGKSTLLKILANVYNFDGGEISLKGKVVPYLELGIGFNTELTGKDNVFLNGAILQLSESEILEKYDEIVEFSGLGRFMNQKLKNYSSGMKMRLAFSIAMQANGDVFLLDEVLAVGDEIFRKKCYEKFKDLQKQNKTAILVSHDLAAVREFCGRALYLREGRVASIGKPDDVINNYLSFHEKVN